MYDIGSIITASEIIKASLRLNILKKVSSHKLFPRPSNLALNEENKPNMNNWKDIKNNNDEKINIFCEEINKIFFGLKIVKIKNKKLNKDG